MTEPRICCFTGHRIIPPAHLDALYPLLDQTILSLIGEGVTVFRAGGAMGFDTLAALRVLRLRHNGQPIELELLLPCRDQTRGWPRESILDYRFILERADRVRYTSEVYTKSCMLQRDRALVDGSDVCVAYLTANRGGTAYTAAYALKRGLTFINLAEKV